MLWDPCQPKREKQGNKKVFYNYESQWKRKEEEKDFFL
jgi:hypothetical protein